MDIISAILLAVALFWIGKIFYILQKSLNEITKALSSIDERLTNIEQNTHLSSSRHREE